MSFLTLERFLSYFPPIEMSKQEFANTFRVTYKNNPTLNEIFDENKILNGKSVIKSLDDSRYLNRYEIIDYFYDIIIANRYKYLELFYNSYFGFKNPYLLKWNADPLVSVSNIDPQALYALNTADLQDKRELLEAILEKGITKVSVQKNDLARIMIRNLNYLDILHTTRILNTSKSKVSFWETLINVYNKLTLEDRFFAPSSIGLYLRKKTGDQINYNNFFYLFQQYQPKASILNPFTVYWLLQNVFKGKTLFTPVLSWSSYLTAFFHSDYNYYVGVDVIPRVCERAQSLVGYYRTLKPNNINKEVEIYCQPSESLLHSPDFLERFDQFFDTVLWCPPYFNMEIYEGEEQSINLYPDYQQWLNKYYKATVQLCYRVTPKGALIGIIMNDYYLLDGSFYPLIKDFHAVTDQYFTLVNVIELINRTSPLRVNKKNRTEKLFIYIKA